MSCPSPTPPTDITSLLAEVLQRLDRIERRLGAEQASPYLDAREAAAYLGLSYSTFRKKRVFIRRMPGVGKNLFRREDLDAFAEATRHRRRK